MEDSNTNNESPQPPTPTPTPQGGDAEGETYENAVPFHPHPPFPQPVLKMDNSTGNTNPNIPIFGFGGIPPPPPHLHWGAAPGVGGGGGTGLPHGSNTPVIGQPMNGGPPCNQFSLSSPLFDLSSSSPSSFSYPVPAATAAAPGNAVIPPTADGMGLLSPPPAGMMVDPLETVLGVFPCVRLRGLPFDACIEDVLVFFQGLVILDVIVLTHGRRGAGEAFVVFSNPMDFQMALQRDRQNMGRRYIEVYQGKRSEYYAAIASQFHAQHHDLHSEQGGKALNYHYHHGETNNPVWSSNVNNDPSASSQSASTSTSAKDPSASSDRNSKSPGGKGGKGGNRSNGYNRYHRTTQGGGVQIGEHTGYLRLRGLPYTSTKQDIANFFQNYNFISDSIVLTYRNDGRPTGEAYIAFAAPDDAKEAMALHRKSMGSRYIELFISYKEEHARALSRSIAR